MIGQIFTLMPPHVYHRTGGCSALLFYWHWEHNLHVLIWSRTLKYVEFRREAALMSI
jgi:hypothetical protein